MTTVTSTKTPNYSDAQVARLFAEAPLNKDKAAALAEEFGKTARSIIAKAKREGIEYVNAEPAKKRPAGATKAVIVADIAALLKVEEIAGLTKAPMDALVSLRNALQN